MGLKAIDAGHPEVRTRAMARPALKGLAFDQLFDLRLGDLATVDPGKLRKDIQHVELRHGIALFDPDRERNALVVEARRNRKIMKDNPSRAVLHDVERLPVGLQKGHIGVQERRIAPPLDFAIGLFLADRTELFGARMAKVNLLIQPHLLGLVAGELDAERVVLRRRQAGENKYLATGDVRLVPNERLVVALAALALCQGRALPILCVGFEFDDLIKDVFEKILDAGGRVFISDDVHFTLVGLSFG